MSSLDVVNGAYEAFGRGDIAAVLDAMTPDMEFYYAEGNPYRSDGTALVGPAEILSHVFAKLPVEWDGFALHPRTFYAAGDTVVVELRYTGTFKATGKKMNAQVCHIWNVRDGRLARFQQYIDTAQMQDVMGVRLAV